MPAKMKPVPPPTPLADLPPPTATDLATPGDDAEAQSKASHPTKGRRYRVLGQGEGDYCIYQIAPASDQLPGGALVPIPEVPQFESTAEARRWARAESGDKLAGKQIMILQVMDIGNFTVVNKPTVSVDWKPKIQVSGPETEEGKT